MCWPSPRTHCQVFLSHVFVNKVVQNRCLSVLSTSNFKWLQTALFSLHLNMCHKYIFRISCCIFTKSLFITSQSKTYTLLIKPPHLSPHTHTPAFINTLSPSDMGVCGHGSGSLGKETRVVDLVMAGGKEKGQRKLLGTKPSPKRWLGILLLTVEQLETWNQNN